MSLQVPIQQTTQRLNSAGDAAYLALNRAEAGLMVKTTCKLRPSATVCVTARARRASSVAVAVRTVVVGWSGARGEEALPTVSWAGG